MFSSRCGTYCEKENQGFIPWFPLGGNRGSLLQRFFRAATTGVPGSGSSLAPRTRQVCETRAVLRRCVTLVPELPSFPRRSGSKTIHLVFLRPTDNRAQSPGADRWGRGLVPREF